ncbi:SDR family NAD(P)-dependent oxidoreductase [Chitiniphilus purpureus]|uniref:SDR family NAD(P)-dependent oxidoreductase n=1 Tax=Chitiniphilus purpureus TaxID=2981137 RepID=A0ABY6DS31_9NEIS|nr:SDR family NAD(P)-dependent oxidoreductase [Chitiniphilus sp. CD1]UXY17137.1 SDR family NAD(P)-dependent oxidoreductase [Chitiniphilus sp. CD1]
MKLAGRKILVTGGTAGIGKALTEQLLAQGCQVVTCGRQQEALRQMEQIKGVHALACDLSSPEQVTEMAHRIAAEHPDLSAIFNNAGVQREFDLTAVPADEVQRIAQQETGVNFLAPVLLTKLLLPTLARQSSAVIVNTTTPLALSPKKSSPIYCATKAALRAYTKALRYQLEDKHPHIRVVEIQPPLVDTNMTKGRGTGKISPEDAAAAMLQGVEQGREEIYVGKAKLLRFIYRWLPSVADRITKRW